jgi:hypothetical protein
LAGVGFALKPFFLPVWLGVEGYLALRRAPAIWKRPENYAIVAFGLGYGLSVLLFAFAYIEVAQWARSVYDAYWSWGFWVLDRSLAAPCSPFRVGSASACKQASSWTTR